jgi:hypothetical protein
VSAKPVRLGQDGKGAFDPANLTLARKEGWARAVYAPRREQPKLFDHAGLKAMAEDVLAAYNRGRRVWHSNLGPIGTPQLNELHEDLWDIVDSNQQDGDKAKGMIALDALAGLGKSTAALAFAMAFHRREVAEQGRVTSQGHERHPVCRISLSGNTSLKDLNRALMEFFAHPGSRRGTSAEFQHRALDCALSCECRLLVLDELHFLRGRRTSAIEVSNQFKTIANDFPVTVLMIGIDLASLGLLGEGTGRASALDQTARRTTRLSIAPFEVESDQGRQEWRNLLLALEQRVVLAEKFPGMIADELADYLFARSTGHISSLITLINRGCQRAIRTGVERLDRGVMDMVKNDVDAERARKELEAALAAGRITTRIASGGTRS